MSTFFNQKYASTGRTIFLVSRRARRERRGEELILQDVLCVFARDFSFFNDQAGRSVARGGARMKLHQEQGPRIRFIAIGIVLLDLRARP